MKINNVFDDIFVIENIVNEDIQNNILRSIQADKDFPWFLSHRIGLPELFPYGEEVPYQNDKITDGLGFVHLAHNGEVQNPTYTIFEPILVNYRALFSKLITDILRVRIRYTCKTTGHDSTKFSVPHVDNLTKEKFKTLIYYIDDSDGDTIFFDKIFDYEKDMKYNPFLDKNLCEVFRYKPTKGHAILFNGHRYHSGNFPIDFDARIVANFDFIEGDPGWIKVQE